MKKFIIFTVFICTMSVKGQVINVSQMGYTATPGVYYKDIDQVFDQFEGTYRLVTADMDLTLRFKKFENFQRVNYTEDILAGEIRLIKNGQLILDNLDRLDLNLTNRYKHQIVGNSIIKPTSRPLCEDCTPNQKRARLIFYGTQYNRNGGAIIVQKLPTLPGQPEQIRIIIQYSIRVLQPGEEKQPALIPSQYFTLSRID